MSVAMRTSSRVIGVNSCLFVAMFSCSAAVLWAQTGTSLDGVVVNQVTGAAISGASVTLFTRQAERYRAITDSAGRFHIVAVDQGQYEAMIEKSGFVLFPKDPVIAAAEPVRLSFQMQFGASQRASLKGHVLDHQDKPAASAQVDLIRGPELRFTTVTDADGRFAFDKLDPGGYKLRAAPSSAGSVATYFPFSLDESGAQRITIRGAAEIDGFRLRSAATFHVRGVVFDEATSKPVAKAIVKLVPIIPQPAHVVASFDSRFLVTPASSGPAPEESRTLTAADGSFDFPSVRQGNWNIVAEAAPLIDARSGFDFTPSGVQSIFVRDSDLQGVQVRLAQTFTFTGSSSWVVAQCHTLEPPSPGGLCPGAVDGRKAPEGTVYPLWLRAVDGQASILDLSVIQADGTYISGPIHPGRYLIQALPALANPAMPKDAHVRDYTATQVQVPFSKSMEPVELRRGSGTIGVSGGGVFDPDGTRPPVPKLLAVPGAVRGAVEKGAGTTVVFLPEEYSQNPSVGQLAFSRPDGTFEALRLAPGSYYCAAFPGLDFEGLRDPELLPRIVAARTQVKVEAGTTTELNLKLTPWPE
jgi:Carboxypeptidase regulatory-like domain